MCLKGLREPDTPLLPHLLPTWLLSLHNLECLPNALGISNATEIRPDCGALSARPRLSLFFPTSHPGFLFIPQFQTCQLALALIGHSVPFAPAPGLSPCRVQLPALGYVVHWGQDHI